ncbi:MAG: RNA polymerase factor sigma-54 [Bacteroidetes bacterium]|nr:RNA polymerase factor sigma-54 [Cryomorphaceae bacterium]MBL6677759.1 RNA polymerase factor sigma-54 [Flavobacteriaceae bacterium]MDA0331024.1 RNA polymerase factor sigma-54 [Bacteroidota bacterium]MDA0885643.1 RNA polymerase factor sigma-54 [Bacteroidota bacterium]MDA1225877.1 RNA polymerase factor sigma-54 [Bacteroidota bacterium]
MLNQKLQLKLTQKLSPQQIQLMKLIQLTTAELEQKIKNEIEENPALETGKEKSETDKDDFEFDINDGVDVDDYITDISDDYDNSQNYYSGEEENTNFQTKATFSFHQYLDDQSKNLILNEKHKPICEFLIGSIDESGYLRREIEDIIDDLAFTQNIISSKEEILSVLEKIQELDPPGVGARSLKECLLLQLRRKNLKESIENSIKIIENDFDSFSNKKFSKLSDRLNLSEQKLKEAIEEISKLNPKPGGSITSDFANNTITPDFILTIEEGNLIVELNKRNSPDLRLSNSYKNILEGYKKDPNKTKSQNQAIQFLKQKLDSAKWFIEAIEQRHQTLFQTVNAIVNFQKNYFLSGEESDLKPMILKDIAEMINMDISTVSRVANSKYIDTPYGIKLLKSYFSEGMKNNEGDDISTIEIKRVLKEIIESEDKAKPLSDIDLSKKLSDNGFMVARRTISKYREQLDIPVARLRKEL